MIQLATHAVEPPAHNASVALEAAIYLALNVSQAVDLENMEELRITLVSLAPPPAHPVPLQTDPQFVLHALLQITSKVVPVVPPATLINTKTILPAYVILAIAPV